MTVWENVLISGAAVLCSMRNKKTNEPVGWNPQCLLRQGDIRIVRTYGPLSLIE